MKQPKINFVLRNVLIKRMGGFEYWDYVPDSVKGKLLYKELKRWKADIIRAFGSMTNYNNHWAKQRGYKNLTEYKYQRVKERGLKSYNDYQNFLYRRKGLKNNAYRQRWQRFFRKSRQLNPNITRREIHERFQEREKMRDNKKEGW